MGCPLHLLHDCIAKVSRQAVEDRVFRENNGLSVSRIHNLDFQQAFLDEIIHLGVL
jgi:hypothetical protein